MNLTLSIFLLGVILIIAFYFLTKKNTQEKADEPIEPEKADEPEEPVDLDPSDMPLRYMKLGKEIRGFDALLYDGMMQESYFENYTRKIGGRDVELVYKLGRDLDQLQLILRNEDVARVKFKIKRQRENSLHFHTSNGCLILVFGEEINNGRWYSEIVAAWELPELIELLDKIKSHDSTLLRDATFDLLYCQNDEILKSLITDLAMIREAVKKTKATGMIRDNRDYTKRAIASIETIQQGGCRCKHYSSDPLCSVRSLEKHELISINDSVVDKENYCMRMEVTCNLCNKHYKVVEQPGGHVEHYIWMKN